MAALWALQFLLRRAAHTKTLPQSRQGGQKKKSVFPGQQLIRYDWLSSIIIRLALAVECSALASTRHQQQPC